MIVGSSLWHPFSDLGGGDDPLILVGGEGIWVEDGAGNTYLDATANLWCCNVGHGRTRLAEAAAQQMTKLAGYHTYGRFSNEPAELLGARLVDLAPFEGARAFLTMGGSDSIDSAAKLARRYWSAMGQPQRRVFVTREDAYHGMHGVGTSLSGISANTAGFGSLLPDVVVVDKADTSSVAELFERRGHEIAAFFGEPVMGAGGIYPPSEEYWREISRLCKEHEILLVADEVVTGFGRVGKWFGSERYGIEPDMITCAKGLTSGYLPLGALLCSPRVQEPFMAERGPMFRHGYTYTGHPTGCAVALENLDILKEEGLVQRVAEIEVDFAREFDRLSDHPLVDDIRTAGLLCGVEIKHGQAEAVTEQTFERGAIVRPLMGKVLQFSPAFVITRDEMADLVSRVGDALDAVLGSAPDVPLPDSRSLPATN